MTPENGAPPAPHMTTFTLTDADGGSHEYMVHAHPPRDGIEVLAKLAAMGAEPLIAFMAAMMDDGVDSSVSAAEMAQAGRGIRDALLQQAPTVLLREILRYTFRDSKPIGKPGAAGDLAFDQAYIRNYWEMMQATWQVVQYNRFFTLPAGFMEKVAARVAAMQAKKPGAVPSPESSPSGTPDDSTTGSGTPPSPT